MKLCIDCVSYTFGSYHACNNIALKSPVTGNIIAMSAEKVRADSQKCGPEGKWFAAKGLAYPDPPLASKPKTA